MPKQVAERLDLVPKHRDVSPEISACERYRQRRNSQGKPLHRRRDRSGVQHVLSHILAMVDSTEDEVRPFCHQRFDGEHHAIRRSAIDLESTFTPLDWPDGMVEREGVARSALLPVRRDDRYFAEWLGGFYQTLQAIGENAVVVGAQQSQRLTIPARCRHSTLITSHASLNSRK